ncbi:MAG: glycoside hydrolase family 3 N-terminal domain-containing protein [Shimia sp.]|uniref:glycoside hydrolase family 3 N-terminal domain-containing protein n=1 Tax=Shimia sp. TaxID=1954381 RepID=UPI00405889B0
MDRFGATIFGCEGLQLSSEERAFFRDVRPFGFILFGRNIESADQVRALCEDLRAYVPHHAPILIDQEGGRVQRFRAPLASEFLPPLEQVVAAGENAERAMYLRYRIIADELLSLGVDANCAPMVDVAHEGTHPFLKNRCYGYDPDNVSRIGRAVAGGLSDGGVLPVVKHMPGHGRAVVDSHFDLPTVAAPVDDLDADFAPFKALNDLPMGMTAHLVYEAIDAAPATTSAKMMQLIRDDIGFGGLVMTDDINMKALKGSLGALSRASIDAGCDVVLHCNGDFAEMQEVAQASGEMTDTAQIRAEAALAARKSPDTVDIEALSAELKAF